MNIQNSGSPLDDESIAAMRKLMNEVGEVKATQVLGLSRESFARALAGLGIRGVTKAAIVGGLALHSRGNKK